MPNNNAYRHGDYPFSVGASAGSTGFIPRVQSVDMTKTLPSQAYYELGNVQAVGVALNTGQYTASVSWFPIDNTLENALKGSGGSAGSLSLKDFVDALGTLIYYPKASIGGSKVVGVQYQCQAPNGELRGTLRIRGTSFVDGTFNIVASTPSGLAALTSKDVSIEVGPTTAVRAMGFTLNAEMRTADLVEFGSADPIAIVYDTPNVSLDIDFYESDAMAGNVEIAPTANTDITITVGTAAGGKKFVCKNMVFTGRPHRGVIQGWATRRYSYISKGDAANYGLQILLPS